MSFDTGISDDRIVNTLMDMRRGLDQRGWCQGRFLENRENFSTPACTLGYLRLATGMFIWGLGARAYLVGHGDDDRMVHVMSYLRRALADVDPVWVAEQPITVKYDIAFWNDHPSRTVDDVRRLFERALELRQVELDQLAHTG